MTYHDSHVQKTDTPMTIPGILALSSNVGTIKIADRLGKDKLVRVPAQVRPRCADRRGAARRVGRARAAGRQLDRHRPRLGPDRQRRLRHPDADGRGLRGDRQRRGLGPAAPGPAVIGPDGKPRTTPAPQTPPGDRPAERAGAAHHARGRHRRSTTRPAGRRRYPGYRVAGKTGTWNWSRTAPTRPATVASFIGMAPADAPRYVVAVFAHVPARQRRVGGRPRLPRHDGVHAAPASGCCRPARSRRSCRSTRDSRQ